MAKKVTTKWIYNFKDKKTKERVKELADNLGLTELEVSILWNRNIRTEEEIKKFLEGNLNDLHDTRLMKDAEKASEKIIEYIKSGELIINYSDYDADGFGCAVVFPTLMRRVGANIKVWTNTRELGFGMSVEGVKQMLEKYPDTKLVVTSDNGIVAFEAVDYLNSLGIEVIITDHHEPSDTGEIPNAYAVVNPKQKDCEYPFKELCGTGVIFKLSMLIYHKLGLNPKDCYDMLDVVALSTIADVVPLIDENRILVKAGIELINKEEKEIWKIMREVFSNNFEEIIEVDSRTIAFSYAPAINACSRLLGSIMLPIELFTLANDEENFDYEKAKDMAERMKETNEERKLLCKDLTHGANALWEKKDNLPVIVLAHHEFHEGVVGIIAGRMKEAFNRPAIVLTEDPKDPNILRGSARSIDNFSLKDVLDEIQIKTNLLEKYGGHTKAAGLSLKKENLDDFELEIVLMAEDMLTEEDFYRKVVIDYAFDEHELDYRAMDLIKNLEPYGEGFEEPIIGLRNFKAENSKEIGSDGQHILLNGKKVKVISWYGTKHWKEMGEPLSVYAVGKISIDNFDKKIQLQAEPDDIRVY